MNHRDIFTNIYENCDWGDNHNPSYKGSSGYGSCLEYNTHYIQLLKKLINEKNIGSVVDLGCGDFCCGKAIYDDLNVKYTGYDTYQKIIQSHKDCYKDPKYKFITLDFYNNKEQIVSADLCILKDVLQHWSTYDIYHFLNYIVNTKKFKYILICNCCNQKYDGQDTITGAWRALTGNLFPLKRYHPIILSTYNSKEISLIDSSAQ
jgi:hypothetical protein